MLALSGKNSLKDMAVWSTDQDILRYLQVNRPNRAQKDFYMCLVMEKLLARIEVLETCIDELITEDSYESH